MANAPEAERLQRKLQKLTAQIDLLSSALSDLRREASNVAAAAWNAIEAAEQAGENRD